MHEDLEQYTCILAGANPRLGFGLEVDLNIKYKISHLASRARRPPHVLPRVLAHRKPVVGRVPVHEILHAPDERREPVKVGLGDATALAQNRRVLRVLEARLDVGHRAPPAHVGHRGKRPHVELPPLLPVRHGLEAHGRVRVDRAGVGVPVAVAKVQVGALGRHLLQRLVPAIAEIVVRPVIAQLLVGHFFDVLGARVRAEAVFKIKHFAKRPHY